MPKIYLKNHNAFTEITKVGINANGTWDVSAISATFQKVDGVWTTNASLTSVTNCYFGGNIGSLPYDAEIEFLESETGVWLDTGIVPDFSTTVEIKGIMYKNASNYLAAARTGSSNANLYNVLMKRDANYLRWMLGSNAGPLVASNYDKEITILFNEYQTHKVYLNGEEKQTFQSGNTVATQTTLALFATNGLGSNHYTGKVRINYCKIQVDGVLVRDFIPVRKGQVGYMYDKVSGELFGNSGTGDFILGPDKS